MRRVRAPVWPKEMARFEETTVLPSLGMALVIIGLMKLKRPLSLWAVSCRPGSTGATDSTSRDWSADELRQALEERH